MNGFEESRRNVTVNGKPAMFAVFEAEDFEALKRGEAVDNNGFRSRKGNYRPRQPRYVDITPEAAEELSKRTPTCGGTAKKVANGVGDYVLREIAIPLLKGTVKSLVLPWLGGIIGNKFYRLTGYGKPIPARVRVIDAEELPPLD